ncbi:hypothetical protein AGMMS49992_15900 [Clostridia bacterium]|nr:hypothetical protein AGMMS49992_15900 [Clostridia bacterium]
MIYFLLGVLFLALAIYFFMSNMMRMTKMRKAKRSAVTDTKKTVNQPERFVRKLRLHSMNAPFEYDIYVDSADFLLNADVMLVEHVYSEDEISRHKDALGDMLSYVRCVKNGQTSIYVTNGNVVITHNGIDRQLLPGDSYALSENDELRFNYLCFQVKSAATSA